MSKLIDQVFNDYIVVNVLTSFIELGILTDLFQGKTLSKESVKNWDQNKLHELLFTARRLDLITGKSVEELRLTPYGKNLAQYMGPMYWANGGYQQLFGNLSQFVKGEKTDFNEAVDGAKVAIASDLGGRFIMGEAVQTTLDNLSFNKMADLGCGNAGRLIEQVNNRPKIRGLGIEVNALAVEEAQANICSNNLEKKIEVLEINVFDAIINKEHLTQLAEVDFLTSFMMMHDLFNTKAPREVIKDLLCAFPNCNTFAFGDTCKSDQSAVPGYFTAGFELAHGFMGIQLHDKSVYLDAFEYNNLVIQNVVDLKVPNTWLFVLNRG